MNLFSLVNLGFLLAINLKSNAYKFMTEIYNVARFAMGRKLGWCRRSLSVCLILLLSFSTLDCVKKRPPAFAY